MHANNSSPIRQLLDRIASGITSPHTDQYTSAINALSELEDSYPDIAERIRSKSQKDKDIAKVVKEMLQELTGMENEVEAKQDVTTNTTDASDATSPGRDIDVSSVSSSSLTRDTENVVSVITNTENVTTNTTNTTNTPPSESVSSLPIDLPKGVHSLVISGEIPDSELFCSDIPFLSVYDNAVLSAPEKTGKTALLYVFIKRILLDDPRNFVFLMSEIPRPATKHLYGMLPPDLHNRVSICSARADSTEEVAKKLTHIRMKNTGRRMLWVIDTLKPFATSCGLDINDNKQMGQLCNFLKEQLGLFAKDNFPCAQLTMHHKGKPNNKGETPIKGMGATAIFSQHSTVVDFQSDKVAQLIQLKWDSQTIDMGSMGIKFTKSVKVGTRTVWSDYTKEEIGEDIEDQRQSVADLEEVSDVVNFVIMCEDKETGCQANPTNLTVWTGSRPSKTTRMFDSALEAGCIKKKGYGSYQLEPNRFIVGGDRATRVNGLREELGLPPASYIANKVDGKNRILKRLES